MSRCVNSIANAVAHLEPATTLETDVTMKTVKVDSALPEAGLVAAIEAVEFHPTVHA